MFEFTYPLPNGPFNILINVISKIISQQNNIYVPVIIQ